MALLAVPVLPPAPNHPQPHTFPTRPSVQILQYHLVTGQYLTTDKLEDTATFATAFRGHDIRVSWPWLRCRVATLNLHSAVLACIAQGSCSGAAVQGCWGPPSTA